MTATEIKTSSILFTPQPTWSFETVTITPTAQLPLPLGVLATPPALNAPPKKRKISQGQARPLPAQVVEIAETSNGKNQDFKSAYGAFFASSAQRSAERFGDILRPVRQPNPLFTQPQDSEDYYDYDSGFEAFDQQWLADRISPVYVASPQQSKSKVFTLYFSGTKVILIMIITLMNKL